MRDERLTREGEGEVIEGREGREDGRREGKGRKDEGKVVSCVVSSLPILVEASMSQRSHSEEEEEDSQGGGRVREEQAG